MRGRNRKVAGLAASLRDVDGVVFRNGVGEFQIHDRRIAPFHDEIGRRLFENDSVVMRKNGESVAQVGFESLGNNTARQRQLNGEMLVVFRSAVLLEVNIEVQCVLVPVT